MNQSSLIADLRVPAEVQVVLRCCAGWVAPDDAQPDHWMPEPIDWAAVRSLANRHRVLPLLYHYLCANCADLVPPAALEQLRRDFYRASLRARYLTRELVRLNKAFATRDVAVLNYKGPTLALAAYRDVAMRQFVDLDVLVMERDIGRAADILRAEGYRRMGRYDVHGTILRECEEPFSKPDGLALVDLHWQIMPRHFPFAPDRAFLWSRARRVNVGEESVLTLAADDLMVVLCVHATKHGWASLSDVCDIARLAVANREVDWAGVVRRAQSFGAARMVLAGMGLARELLGAQPPAELISMARRDQNVTAIVRRAARGLLTASSTSQPLSQSWLVPLLSIERGCQRVRYCVERALSPTGLESRFLPLPRFMLPLHIFTRPVRLAFKLRDHLARRKTAFLRGPSRSAP